MYHVGKYNIKLKKGDDMELKYIGVKSKYVHKLKESLC